MRPAVVPIRVLPLLLALGCGASGQPASPAAAPVPEEVRYYAAVPMPVDATGEVETEALEGARAFVRQQLARHGGAPGPNRVGGPVYVFSVAVGSIEAHRSGRTRASVTTTVSTQRTGRIVGSMRGTATAFVERSQPLAVRQRRALEGAIEGALRRLPDLLARLEQDPRHARAEASWVP